MATVDFTLDDLDLRMRGIVREEVAELKGDIADLKGDIQSVRVELKGDIQSVRVELKDDIESVRTELKGDIQSLKKMFGEDYEAEVDRVSRIERRLAKTRVELHQHLEDPAAHRA